MPSGLVGIQLQSVWELFFMPLILGEDSSKPYPFFLSTPLEKTADETRRSEIWASVEWKLGMAFGTVDSSFRRGLLSGVEGKNWFCDKFPETPRLGEKPSRWNVLEEKLLFSRWLSPPINLLQTRNNRRKNLSKKILETATGSSIR